MSPVQVSESHKGTPDDAPYVPSWCYKSGPRMCPCGHHEGYHNDAGECLRTHECRCVGLPPDKLTPIDEV